MKPLLETKRVASPEGAGIASVLAGKKDQYASVEQVLQWTPPRCFDFDLKVPKTVSELRTNANKNACLNA